MKVTVIPIVVDALGTVIKGLKKRLEELEISGRTEIIYTAKINKNIQKSTEDLRRLAVTQTPMKDHQLKQV